VRITGPDQAWGSDATCVLTGQGWLYVVVVLDLFSLRVVGWSMSAHLDAQMMLDALQMAIKRRRPKPGLVVHSDRGAQYASADYRHLLACHGLIASMSRKGNCYDNAFVESFWSSLKYETVYQHRFATRAEAKAARFDYIEAFYNRRRLHSSLGYVSPITFESQLN
jgi:putative transposase